MKFQSFDKCEKSFQKLKERLISASILGLPTSGKKFTIYSDDSIHGLGLMQERSIIAYASKQLKPHERKYLVHDWESTTLILALKL